MATVLDWSSTGPNGPGSIGPPKPCGLCKVPTIMRSPAGKACHKVCAEAYLDRRAEAAREREQARTAGVAHTAQAIHRTDARHDDDALTLTL